MRQFRCSFATPVARKGWARSQSTSSRLDLAIWVRRAKRFSARCAQSRWFVLDGTALRVDATPARSAVDLRRTYTQRRRERARTRHDMSGLSPEVQALKDEGNKNFRVAEYLKAAASYTKALKQAERDGSEQCVAAKRHHETPRDRVFSRAQTLSPLRRVPRASRLERREEKPLLST